jgi:hypothetical protein
MFMASTGTDEGVSRVGPQKRAVSGRLAPPNSRYSLPTGQVHADTMIMTAVHSMFAVQRCSGWPSLARCLPLSADIELGWRQTTVGNLQEHAFGLSQRGKRGRTRSRRSLALTLLVVTRGKHPDIEFGGILRRLTRWRGCLGLSIAVCHA